MAPSSRVLGAFWGSMLAHVGVCWPILRYLQDLKAFSRRNVRSWGQLGVNLEDFGANLEDFGAILETMLAYVGVCVAILKHLKVNSCTTCCFLQKPSKTRCFTLFFEGWSVQVEANFDYARPMLRIFGTSWRLVGLS